MIFYILFAKICRLKFNSLGGNVMSRVCSICGKGKMGGHQVSHSNIKTNKQWNANVQKVSIEVDGVEKKQYVCTKCLKTAKKA